MANPSADWFSSTYLQSMARCLPHGLYHCFLLPSRLKRPVLFDCRLLSCFENVSHALSNNIFLIPLGLHRPKPLHNRRWKSWVHLPVWGLWSRRHEQKHTSQCKSLCETGNNPALRPLSEEPPRAFTAGGRRNVLFKSKQGHCGGWNGQGTLKTWPRLDSCVILGKFFFFK